MRISEKEKRAISEGLKREIEEIKKTENDIIAFLYSGEINLSYKQGTIIQCALVRELMYKKEFLKLVTEDE